MYKSIHVKTNVRPFIERGFNYCVIKFDKIFNLEAYCIYPFKKKVRAIEFNSGGLAHLDGRVMYIPDAVKEYDFLVCE